MSSSILRNNIKVLIYKFYENSAVFFDIFKYNAEQFMESLVRQTDKYNCYLHNKNDFIGF